MLSDNIKILRKKKGYSQETLAEQLHVVRQTISKWEKGISVPDAVMLDRMAELFEVPVSVLLGGGLEVEEEQPSELNEIAQQVGYANASYFYNIFKKYTNKTPSQYRKMR